MSWLGGIAAKNGRKKMWSHAAKLTIKHSRGGRPLKTSSYHEVV